MTDVLDDLLARFRAGDPHALARAISLVERRTAAGTEFLEAIRSRELGRRSPEPRRRGSASARGSVRVGVTGPPGAGKSSLTSTLIALLRKEGEEVGVLAVDPSSPYSGGALLGDRVRMGEHAADPGVFIRSVASRGAPGGLFPTAHAVLDVMEAFGFPWLIVETVGAGQGEGEIAGAVDTVVALFVPESGDAIQAMKAGIREVADVLVVNKGDRPGAESVARDLRTSLELGRARQSTWTPPVLVTTAVTGEGAAEVLDAVRRYCVHLVESGEGEVARVALAAGASVGSGAPGGDDPGATTSRERRIRVLIAKPGLDGHDRGARVVASAFRDAGFEVVYTGLHQTPEMIAAVAVQEDVDVVAVSVLSGAHMTLLPRVRERLDAAGLDDVLITGGGIIPAADAERLGALGIGRLFGPGSPTGEAVEYVREWFRGARGRSQ